MTIRFLVDMNLSPAWVSFLSDAGMSAVHWSDIGPGNAADALLMKWAAERGDVVLTADLDFSALLASSQGTRPSVVQVRSDLLTPSSIGALVLRTVRLVEADIERGAIVSVDAAGARLRILPLMPR